MAINWQQLKIEILADTKYFIDAINGLAIPVETLAGNLQHIGDIVEKSISAPIRKAVNSSVASYATLENGLVRATAIMDVTGDQAERMKRLALELGAQGYLGPEKIADAYNVLASAGYDAEQQMALMPQLQKFAQAGNLGIEQAATLATEAQAALGLKLADAAMNAKQFERITNSLIQANRRSQGTVLDFSRALGKDSASAMKMMGIEVEDGVAVLMAYAEAGYKATTASRMLGRAIRLVSAAAVKKGPQQDKYGFSAFYQEGPKKGHMKSFPEIIENLNKSLAKYNPKARAGILVEMGFQARQQEAILPLLDRANQIKQFKNELMGIKGLAGEVSAKMMGSLTNSFKQLLNTIKVTGMEIVIFFEPAIRQIIGIGQRLADLFRAMPDSFKAFVGLAAIIAAVAGPLATIAGFIGPQFVMVFNRIAGLFRVVGSIAALLGAKFLIIVGIIGAAIGLIVYYMGGPTQAFDTIKDAVMSVVEFWKPAFQAMGAAAMAFGASLRSVFNSLMGPIRAVWGVIKDFFSWLGSKIYGAVYNIMLFLRDSIIETAIAFEWALTKGKDLDSLLLIGIQYQIVKLTNQIIYLMEVVAKLGLWLGDNFVDVFTTVWSFLSNGFKNLAMNITNLMINIPELISGKMTFDQLWTPMLTGFKNSIKKMPDITSREEGRLEKQLREEYERLANKIDKDYAAFRARRLAELFPDKKEEKEVADPTKPDPGTEDQPKGKGKQSSGRDSAERFSVEGIRRVQNYFNNLQDAQIDPAVVTARNTAKFLQKQDAAEKLQRKQLEKLEEIRKQGVDKANIVQIAPANFNV